MSVTRPTSRDLSQPGLGSGTGARGTPMPPIRTLGVMAFLILLPIPGTGRAAAQSAIACPASSGIAPSSITVTNTPPNVTVQWAAVRGARGYAVIRRNPNGQCWNLTTTGTTATTLQEPTPSAAGTYGYQVVTQTISGTTASQVMPLTVTATAVASRSFTLPAITAAGAVVSVASRSLQLAGFTAAGAAVEIKSRAFSLPGFTAAGASVVVSSRDIQLAGFTAAGTGVLVSSRAFTLAGFAGSGGAVAVGSRNISLSGWTAMGLNPP